MLGGAGVLGAGQDIWEVLGGLRAVAFFPVWKDFNILIAGKPKLVHTSIDLWWGAQKYDRIPFLSSNSFMSEITFPFFFPSLLTQVLNFFFPCRA